MFWPVGYRHCREVFDRAGDYTAVSFPDLDRNSMPFRNKTMSLTMDTLADTMTLSVAFIDGRTVRVSTNLFLSYWAISRDGGEVEPLLFYWNDEFGFDPSVARYFEAHLSYQVYLQNEKSGHYSIWEKAKKLGEKVITGERLFGEDEMQKHVISLPTRPESLAGAERHHLEIARQNWAANAMRGGQLVLEASEFDKLIQTFETADGKPRPTAHASPKRPRGRPALESRLSDVLLSVFMERIEEFQGVKQDSVVKAAQEWAKKHTGHEPGRSTVQDWLAPVLERLAGK